MSNPFHLHIGLGQFFKAHQALYTQFSDQHWDIVGVSLRTPKSVNELQKNNFKYSVVENSVGTNSIREVNCIKDAFFAPENEKKYREIFASSNTKVVTLTVTEKAYNKELFAWLEKGLHERLSKDSGPLTIISCDNLPNNGNYLKGGLIKFLRESNSDLANWTEKNIAFPNTMVDRIVPAQEDPLNMQTESFKQWVIEDKFASDRPNWEAFGAEFVSDVESFEEMKLRLLNGSHSTMAYLGLLSGYETVDQAIDCDVLGNWIRRQMREELAPTLDIKETSNYQKQLIERFRNPNLHHRLAQIATDGSKKIPQRLLEPMTEQDEVIMIPYAIAGWISVMMSWGDDLPVIMDPLSHWFQDFQKEHSLPDKEGITKILSETGIFPQPLQSDSFAERLSQICSQFKELGVIPTLERALRD